MKVMTEREFKELHKLKKYSELGWYFWNAFIFLRGKEREKVKIQYKKLTKRERELCEELGP